MSTPGKSLRIDRGLIEEKLVWMRQRFDHYKHHANLAKLIGDTIGHAEFNAKASTFKLCADELQHAIRTSDARHVPRKKPGPK